METLNLTAVIAAVRAAVDERNARRDALGARIAEIARETMDACGVTRIESEDWCLDAGHVHARINQAPGWDESTGE